MTEWLDHTDFGRYALIPEGLLPRWEGSEADEVIDEYVSAIRVAGHDVLTLGAEPLPVTWLAAPLIFARPYGTDDDAELLTAVRAAVAADDWEDVTSVELGGRYVLTDAAYDGRRVLRSLREAPRQPEALRVALPPRRYRVRSPALGPDRSAPFLLSRLLPE
ncbi:Imm21 family immunity protein [Streptomyces sp. enrichment culture]|uniref:Imm21 family immunity protein n=1 Tax=Streptomyces sp. enrichment culture TaxID=1795815 RepID=UPI003F574DF3